MIENPLIPPPKTEAEIKKLKIIKPKYFIIPVIQGFTGAYMALSISSIINTDSYLHQKLNNYVQNVVLHWIILIAFASVSITVELLQIKLMLTSLKKVGSSFMVISVYVSNIFFAGLANYLTGGGLPDVYQAIGAS